MIQSMTYPEFKEHIEYRIEAIDRERARVRKLESEVYRLEKKLEVIENQQSEPDER